MRTLINATAIFAMIAISPAAARSGHGHRHQMHRHSASASSMPADPGKAAANSPDRRDPEDTKIDLKIKSICRGC